MPRILSLVFLFCLARLAAAEEPPMPQVHREISLVGWMVRVDERLYAAPHAELGQRALKLLEARLMDITTVVPEARLADLRAVPLVLDLTHGKLTSMQYHPSRQWLTANGYAASLAKCVHLPDAARFVAARHQFVQPWCVLHELAHAFHDRVLGFDHAKVEGVWERYVAGERGVSTLHIGGRRIRHYALTNAKEFFAEMTEAYFGMNDFFPFNYAELKEAEPETFALLAEIWGAVPK